MNSENDPSNWVPINQGSKGTVAVDTKSSGPNDPSNWEPVQADKSGVTAWDNFRQQQPKSTMTDQQLSDQGESDYADLRKADQGQDKAQASSSPQKADNSPLNANKGQTPKVGSTDIEYPTEEINPDDIPF